MLVVSVDCTNKDPCGNCNAVFTGALLGYFAPSETIVPQIVSAPLNDLVLSSFATSSAVFRRDPFSSNAT